MKTTKKSWNAIERGSRGMFDGAKFQQPECDALYSDLAELQRLESEPRCMWVQIDGEQRGGAYWIVGSHRGPAVMARYTQALEWTANDRHPLGIQPTHYLANIPPVPEPVKAPTAEEWADAVISAHVARGESETTEAEARLSRLMERHNAATK